MFTDIAQALDRRQAMQVSGIEANPLTKLVISRSMHWHLLLLDRLPNQRSVKPMFSCQRILACTWARTEILSLTWKPSSPWNALEDSADTRPSSRHSDTNFIPASRPFKIIQGRWFWYQSKGRMRLQSLMITLVSWSKWSHLALFLRYGELLAENCKFSHPILMQRRRLGWTLWNFWLNFVSQDYSPWAIRQWIFSDPTLRHFDTVPTCNG